MVHQQNVKILMSVMMNHPLIQELQITQKVGIYHWQAKQKRLLLPGFEMSELANDLPDRLTFNFEIWIMPNNHTWHIRISVCSTWVWITFWVWIWMVLIDHQWYKGLLPYCTVFETARSCWYYFITPKYHWAQYKMFGKFLYCHHWIKLLSVLNHWILKYNI